MAPRYLTPDPFKVIFCEEEKAKVGVNGKAAHIYRDGFF